jgi:hypothetical protein
LAAGLRGEGRHTQRDRRRDGGEEEVRLVGVVRSPRNTLGGGHKHRLILHEGRVEVELAAHVAQLRLERHVGRRDGDGRTHAEAREGARYGVGHRQRRRQRVTGVGVGLAVGVLVNGGVELEAEAERQRLEVGDRRRLHWQRPERGWHRGYRSRRRTEGVHRVGPHSGPACVPVHLRARSRSDTVVGVCMGMEVHVVVPGRLGVGMEDKVLDRQVGRTGPVGAALTGGIELAVERARDAAVARAASEALQWACQ